MEPALKTTDHHMRRLARLAAVQGLYQIALGDEGSQDLIRRFKADPGVLLDEGQSRINMDTELCISIISGVSENTASLDEMIAGTMDAKLSADRLEPLLKAILRGGIYELLHHGSTPANIIVNDYIDVAHGFFDAKEPGLVNAILDKLSKKIRS